MKEHWSKKQPRGGSKPYRFSPKWELKTMWWIIDRLNNMVDFIDIQYRLAKDYGVSIKTAANWIEIARRVMVDMRNGLSIENALERDKERRNMLRRKQS
jgi:hypothetical protein